MFPCRSKPMYPAYVQVMAWLLALLVATAHAQNVKPEPAQQLKEDVEKFVKCAVRQQCEARPPG